LTEGTVAAVAIGSNLGDRRAHIRFACERLAALLADLKISSLYETAPVGAPGDQPSFLNAAAVGAATLEPRRLLRELLAIEDASGRTRPFRNAPRTLDLDLVLYGDLTIDELTLQLPHPRFRERSFVLEPLAQIGPDLRDPVSGRSVAELLRLLPPASRVPGR